MEFSFINAQKPNSVEEEQGTPYFPTKNDILSSNSQINSTSMKNIENCIYSSKNMETKQPSEFGNPTPIFPPKYFSSIESHPFFVSQNDKGIFYYFVFLVL
jgi:hypothetical protein